RTRPPEAPGGPPSHSRSGGVCPSARMPRGSCTAATGPAGICAATRVSGLRRRRSEEHTSELQSQSNLVCRLLLEKKNQPEAPRSGRDFTFDGNTIRLGIGTVKNICQQSVQHILAPRPSGPYRSLETLFPTVDLHR